MKIHLIPIIFGLGALGCDSNPVYIHEDGSDDGQQGGGGGYYTSGNKIMTSDGQVARFNGINWYGFEDDYMIVHGLNRRSLDSYLDQIAGLGYNLIRLPFSNEMLKAQAPNQELIDFALNPDLQGKTPLQWFDIFIEKAGARNLKIILDRHRIMASDQSELWYEGSYSEQVWIDDWKMLAERYRDQPHVIGADLHNEPHASASWGTDNAQTDWRLAAERAGNAILAVQPNWLIIVEGTEKNIPMVGEYYWWGGNLMGVRDYPVRLNVANRLVYSVHDYGPEIASMPWLEDPGFPGNLPSDWDRFWGYVHKEGIAPVLVGEFGAKNVQAGTDSGQWFSALIDYIKTNELYWTFWTWTPDSGDTGGLLSGDWQAINQDKQTLLQQLY